ncbi:class I SAM-dependent methyltransferase [Blautia hydrogenotrophica]|uniref:class I SAM-dependent methyltransferase n=2 Tax=Blautia hydrogenotrophica TaxID=53443 RepID=UPI0006C1B245|nr:class I SAM-dependent methyltransferase [Blautia hydrogenotrophica]MEE0461436.1 class I SAM-dependent methyltransferase [Blautia hydrogenotrophica]CUN03410.1 Dimethylglycine N-methyltransferase [Blautia hydrogenotrophica]SCH98749.1 Dimethylglycine N-methyltransferase [uncultured Blautia sp.]
MGELETKHLSMVDILLETHIGLERQGPGSSEAVEQALGFLKPLNQFSKIVDLGCGTGGQTLLLAKYLSGTIIGLDMFSDFIDKLNENARKMKLDNRVTGIIGSMEKLPFQTKSLDLIWSEGAIDNIGFKEGLSHWHGFLKKGGFIAVTCPSWLTEERPNVVERFWNDAGSQLETISDNIKIMQKCGYQFVASFALPQKCWTENYFIPREKAINKLLEKYAGNKIMMEYAEQNRYETELYSKYSQHYGYVFYIGKVI